MASPSDELSEQQQQAVCREYGAAFVPSPGHLKLGISLGVREGLLPIHGMRHPPEAETSGWYIWAGEELSESSEFFVPLHVHHMSEWCSHIIKYLGLPPGWRFLFAPDRIDVWEDPSLLDV